MPPTEGRPLPLWLPPQRAQGGRGFGGGGMVSPRTEDGVFLGYRSDRVRVSRIIERAGNIA